MDEERIVLDRKSFEALAVDTRVKLLKSLKQRRKTLSELSKEQNMSVSGLTEHLEKLEKVGLVKKIDDGHKWKYYELTKKGSDVIAPKELRVWILLSISLVAFVASAFFIFRPASTEAPVLAASAVPEGAAKAFAAENTLAADASGLQDSDLTIPFAVAGISLLTVIGCLSILARNRMRATSP